MNKYQLKRLIKEVIREADGMAANKEQDTDDSSKDPKSDDSVMKHSLKHEKEYGTTAIFHLKGVSKGNTHILKDFLAQAAYAAKMADLEVINAEIEKDGQEIVTMDISDLKSAKPTVANKGNDDQASSSKSNASQPNFDNFDPEELQRWNDPKTTPYERRQLIKLSKIKRGEKAAEYQADTKADAEKDRQKMARKKSMIAAGTFNPSDTSLWTDKQWDAYEQEKQAGGSDKEAERAAMEIDIDPSNKKRWTNIQWSYYNTAKQQGKSEEQALAAVDAISTGGKKYTPKFKDKNAKNLNMTSKVGAPLTLRH